MDYPRVTEIRLARYSVDLGLLRERDAEIRKVDAKLWDDITDADLGGAVDVSEEILDEGS
jgi:hypothetical protein